MAVFRVNPAWSEPKNILSIFYFIITEKDIKNKDLIKNQMIYNINRQLYSWELNLMWFYGMFDPRKLSFYQYLVEVA